MYAETQSDPERKLQVTSNRHFFRADEAVVKAVIEAGRHPVSVGSGVSQARARFSLATVKSILSRPGWMSSSSLPCALRWRGVNETTRRMAHGMLYGL